MSALAPVVFYEKPRGDSRLDFNCKLGIPPPWLPEWFLDRLNRPSFEKPLEPNTINQAICHGLGLTNILIEALSTCISTLSSCEIIEEPNTAKKKRKQPRLTLPLTTSEQAEALMDSKTPDIKLSPAAVVSLHKLFKLKGQVFLKQGFVKWAVVFNPRRTNTQRVTEVCENIFYCLSGVIDQYSPAKRGVLENIDKVVGIVEKGRAASPRQLVTLCGKLFKNEPELCAEADRGLLRLMCKYVHRVTYCLAENKFDDASSSKYNEPTSSREAANSFLVATMNLLSMISGGDEPRPIRATQLFVAARLIPDKENDPLVGRLQSFAENPALMRGRIFATDRSRMAFVKLLQTLVKQGGDARRVRFVLPM